MKTTINEIIKAGRKLSGKVLLTLDHPSKIITENPDIAEEFFYAVIADSIADVSDEGSAVIMFDTKEDFEAGRGTVTYMTGCMIENVFEYDAKLI